MERAGTRDTEILVQQPAGGGAPAGSFEDFDTFWVSVEVRPVERETRNGMSFDRDAARFRFEWTDGAAISRDMRIAFEDRFYEIRSIDKMSDTRKTVIVDAVMTLADGGRLEEAIERRIREGIVVEVERQERGVPAVKRPARAIVEGYRPEELVAGLKQGDRHIFILASDILGSALGKLKDGDRIILPDGEKLTAMNVDAYTHRVGTNLIAYELTGQGF